MKQLLTFGCSWTFGVGACWQPGMTEDELRKCAWTEESEHLSFRSIISNELNLMNLNFSKGKTSNDRSFRIAQELIADKAILADLKDTVVLWGITSTARTEFWNIEANKYTDIKYDIKGRTDAHEALRIF